MILVQDDRDPQCYSYMLNQQDFFLLAQHMLCGNRRAAVLRNGDGQRIGRVEFSTMRFSNNNHIRNHLGLDPIPLGEREEGYFEPL